MTAGGSAVARVTAVCTFRWASEDGIHGTALAGELEAAGWVQVAPHPRFPRTWLYVESVPDAGKSVPGERAGARTESDPSRATGTDYRGGGTDLRRSSDEVAAALAEGPLSGKTIARQLRCRPKATLAVLRALEAAGRVGREGKGRSARFRLLRESMGGPKAEVDQDVRRHWNAADGVASRRLQALDTAWTAYRSAKTDVAQRAAATELWRMWPAVARALGVPESPL